MKSKKFQLFGVGNAIVDLFVDITEEEFRSLNLVKGSMNLVSSETQRHLLSRIRSHKRSLVSGGSVANSMIAFQQLGGKGTLCCFLGTDEYGRFYREECLSLGLDIEAGESDSPTGISLILITPDAERTMNTSLGAACGPRNQEVSIDKIKDSEWVYIEGYRLSQPDSSYPAALKIAKIAKDCGTKVALTFSDSFLVSGFRQQLDSVVEHADLIFANSAEACAYVGSNDAVAAYKQLKNIVPNVVLTRSDEGALIYLNGKDYQVQAFQCRPIDLTGAGDMFAGAFMYGITNGYSPEQSGRAACFLAMKVISQIGARLKGDIQSLWKEALNN